MNKKFMSKMLTALCLVVMFVSCKKNKTPTEKVSQGVNYTISSTVFANPERGFMHTYIVYSEGTSLSLPLLKSIRASNVSLFLRLFYFDKFKDKALSTAQLNLIQDDFDKTREAGLKMILRFAYSETGDDAPLNIVTQHLDQLKPLFEANKDVIAFMQAGFIGNYGEWHSSSNNLTTPANQKAVVDKILSVLPADLMIQLRTPQQKRQIFNNALVTETNGYSAESVARVGHHNDCFLTGGTEYGTYVNIIADKQYLSNEGAFVVNGGETCPPVGSFAPTCEIAKADMKLLKWTYLNLDYFQPTLNLWRNAGCFEEFQRSLGYRLAFLTTNLPAEVKTNGNLAVNMTITNRGFAPLYHQKKSYLILKNIATNTYHEFALAVDLRKCKPNVDVKIDEIVKIGNLPAGNYAAYLRIADKAPRLKSRIEYAVQLANTEVWVTENGGMNRIKKDLTVTAL